MNILLKISLIVKSDSKKVVITKVTINNKSQI